MRTRVRAFLALLSTFLLILGLGVVTAVPAAASTTTVTHNESDSYSVGGLANQVEPCFFIQTKLIGHHEDGRNQVYYFRYTSQNICTGENAAVISGSIGSIGVGDTSGGDVEVAKDLSSGTIKATIPLTDGQSATGTSVTINETFTAIGPSVRTRLDSRDDGTDPNYSRRVTDVMDQAPATSVGYPDQGYLSHENIKTVTRVKTP